jgi:predicted MFS family arabinose efflux permease
MFYSIGAACGGLIYMKVLTGRYKVGTLAAALILVGASVQALFVFMSDYHTGIALNLANGFVTAMALLNAHVIAANRCPDHAEGFMYSILLSIANISFSTSQWLGAHLYDEHFGKQIEPLILLSAGLTFLCVFMVPFLNFEKQASTAAKAEVNAEA